MIYVSQGFPHIHIRQSQVHLRRDALRVRRQPCRLCFEHVAHRDDALAHAERGVAQVFVGFLAAVHGRTQPLYRLIQPSAALAHLQLHLLARLLQLIARHGGLSLRSLHLIYALAEGDNRYVNHHADTPHALEIAFETVENRRVRPYPATRKRHRRQIFGTRQPHLVAVDVG